MLYSPSSPAGLSHSPNGGATATALYRKAADAIGLAWGESASIVLRRGPYIIAAGLDESPVGGDPISLTGRFISLFDHTLALTRELVVVPNLRALLVDLDRLPTDKPVIAAAACGIADEQSTTGAMTFRAAGVQGSRAVVAILAPQTPASATVAGKPLPPENVQYADGLLRISFTNEADGVDVQVRW